MRTPHATLYGALSFPNSRVARNSALGVVHIHAVIKFRLLRSYGINTHLLWHHAVMSLWTFSGQKPIRWSLPLICVHKWSVSCQPPQVYLLTLIVLSKYRTALFFSVHSDVNVDVAPSVGSSWDTFTHWGSFHIWSIIVVSANLRALFICWSRWPTSLGTSLVQALYIMWKSVTWLFRLPSDQ